MSNYSQRHGGPFDRGSADSYYGRGYEPHFYVGNSYSSRLVEEHEMTEHEKKAYAAGYAYNESCGDKKDWR